MKRIIFFSYDYHAWLSIVMEEEVVISVLRNKANIILGWGSHITIFLVSHSLFQLLVTALATGSSWNRSRQHWMPPLSHQLRPRRSKCGSNRYLTSRYASNSLHVRRMDRPWRNPNSEVGLTSASSHSDHQIRRNDSLEAWSCWSSCGPQWCCWSYPYAKRRCLSQTPCFQWLPHGKKKTLHNTCRTQMWPQSTLNTRAPESRRAKVWPLPTSRYPHTSACFPPIITSIMRMMQSLNEWTRYRTWTSSRNHSYWWRWRVSHPC